MAKTIRYAGGQSSLGPFVAAISDRGLAMLEFGNMNEMRMQALRTRFPDSEIVEDPEALRETLGLAAGLVDHPEGDVDLALDLQGSAFEFRVWTALRQIPAGTTASYGEIAARLGSPRGAREVAEACAANILAIAVPCHRVVKKDGSISGYRWGFARKRTLLAREHRAHLLQGSAEGLHEIASD
ncbi:MAG: methylated-DNA--[protein]-cysteine S-methyltransferase [Reyranella sp.]|uniref:methylated-DNA--[protein]-cysteine S-methyltransferase n=1 Tax=Reyranella sp. TaxID=1929291 RepID=UPI0027312D00|nr:methylated-DNA--[protein]-cysteine S-methyltransferase [Reyranella sp.]MDP1963218.1 methylated-DNA--[protein]-cysteine S-methyltransferase [Reyranella sp.]MDP2374205.1 methylated-DNA--[protein]-cysteine S-methyltransferase [Reyranella sp.]